MAMASGPVPPADVQVEECTARSSHGPKCASPDAYASTGARPHRREVLLQNVGTEPMVLAEQEFDRPVVVKREVAGIAIEHHNLRPGESTTT